MDKYKKFIIKYKVQIILLSLTFILIFYIYSYIDNLGKINVFIKVLPEDSVVYINNKKSNAGNNHLKPGKYTIKASKDGFKDDSVTVYVESSELNIGLTPDPNSEEANKWLRDNPQIQEEREAIGGQMASLRGEYVEKQTPLINSLPYDDISAPFSIDYGGSKNRSYGTFIVISNAVPQSRVEALNWIRQQGTSPTDIEIQYKDFKNPLVEGGE